MKFFTVSSLVLFILFIGGCSFFRGKISQDTSQDDFNIILVTIDALRADHLSCYGYERKTTPNIDWIAEQGILFKNAIASSSWTVPSIASLFTSVYPSNHRVTECIFFNLAEEKHILSNELTTLAEILKANGYTTFGVSSNVNLSEKRGFKRGFDYFKHLIKNSTAPAVNESVYSWENEIKSSNKFFLWVHYLDPHYPYYAKEPWILQYTPQELIFRISEKDKLNDLKPTFTEFPFLLDSLIAHYDSEINFVDNHIGELIQRFELNKNTLMIITADHGEEFLEHDNFSHGHNLHKETIHIPLIAKLPYNTKKEMVERHVNLVDIMPSILQTLNIKPPEQTLGKSFWPKGKLLKTNTFDYSYSELDLQNSFKSIITPQWKYIYDYQSMKDQLYNIQSDPLEQINLADKNILQAGKLKKQLFDWVLHSKIYLANSQSLQLSQEEKEALEALGYLTVEKTGDDDNDDICDPGISDPACTGSDNCQFVYNPNQQDTYPPQGNGIGDACDCEGDFDCDGDVDRYDFETFMANYNQSKLDKPASAIDLSRGDFDCDLDVDYNDQIKFLEDFGRNPSNNPCPACKVGEWCTSQ